MAVGPGGRSAHYYGLFLDGAATAPRRAAFLQDGNGSYPPVYSAAGAVPTGSGAAQWTHLAVTHDGRTAVIYVNGVASTTATDRRALGTLPSAILMVAGADNGLDPFTGDLDEIRIFNRAVSAAEVTTLAGGGAVGTPVSSSASAAGNVTGASKFTNVSVRGPTGTEDSTLILGLNVAGQGKRTLLTRGIGPTLGAFGVAGAIVDPQLEIFDGSGRAILANNDWSAADFIPEMLAAREFVGAFALPGGSADASTLALLDPGSYTLQITAGSGVARGDALVEIYEVP